MTRGNRIRNKFSRISLGLVMFAGSMLLAFESFADWDVYVSGGLGISTAVIDTDGVFDPTTTPPLTFGKDDSDSSPLLDGAVGLRIPMDELVAREWLPDLRLPSYPYRIEIEAAGLREFELETQFGPQKFFSDVKATTVMVNQWLDIPLIELWRPVQYLGGLGRQPRLRQWLEPASLFFGWGVGFSYLEIEGTSNIVSGSDDIFDFAWNVGAGLNYALTDHVDLSGGYRYVGLGKQKVDMSLTGGGQEGPVEYDPQVHEVRVQIRVKVYDFLSPWR